MSVPLGIRRKHSSGKTDEGRVSHQNRHTTLQCARTESRDGNMMRGINQPVGSPICSRMRSRSP
jgi:hypothetical protein